MPRSSLRLPTGPQRLALAEGHEMQLIHPRFLGVADKRPIARMGDAIGELGQRLVHLPGQLIPAAAEDDDPARSWAPDCPEWADSADPSPHGYTLVEDVAVLDVEGPLFSKGFVDGWSGLYYPGYRDYVSAIRAANADDRVSAVLIRYDTPGGYCAGCSEAAEALYQMSARNGGKPIVSHVTELSASAGQYLSAQSDVCLASESAVVGSVGVRILFFDMSGFLGRVGDTVHVFKSGDLKDMGSPWRPPTEQEAGLFQAEVDHLAEGFFAAIARGRDQDIAQIRDHRGWDARTFTAGDPPPPEDLDPMADSVDLIDEVMTEEAAFALARSLAKPSRSAPNPSQGPTGAQSQNGDEPMSLKAKIAALKAKAEDGDDAAAAELADIQACLGARSETDDTPDAETDEDEAQSSDETEDDSAGSKDDEADETASKDEDADSEDESEDPEARADQVLSAPAAKGREALAGRLAVRVARGNMTVKAALADLAAAPQGVGFRGAASTFTPRGAKPGSGASADGSKASQADAALSKARKAIAARGV